MRTNFCVCIFLENRIQPTTYWTQTKRRAISLSKRRGWRFVLFSISESFEAFVFYGGKFYIFDKTKTSISREFILAAKVGKSSVLLHTYTNPYHVLCSSLSLERRKCGRRRRLCESHLESLTRSWKAKLSSSCKESFFPSRLEPSTLCHSRESKKPSESECDGGRKQVACAGGGRGVSFEKIHFSLRLRVTFTMCWWMTFDCVVKIIRFSPPPNAMLHNANRESLAPLTIPRSLDLSSHQRHVGWRFPFSFWVFLHAQQQWKIVLALILHANSTRSPTLAFRFRGASSTTAPLEHQEKTASLTPVRNHLRMSFNLN